MNDPENIKTGLNYIKLINRFWLMDIEQGFSHLEVHLYFKLLEINNRLGWKEYFKYPNSRLESGVGTRQKNLIDARQKLIDAGLIEYKKGTTRDAGVYQLLSNMATKESNKESNEVDCDSKDLQKKVIEGTLNKQYQTELSFSSDQAKTSLSDSSRQNISQTVGIKKEKTPIRRKHPEALQFPFTGPEFMIAWNKLITLKKWRNKEPAATQQALDNISKYDEEFAINQINRAIAGNWQGLTFSNTDDEFLKWKNQKNGQTFNNSSKSKLAGNYQAAEQLAREIEEKSRNFTSPLHQTG